MDTGKRVESDEPASITKGAIMKILLVDDDDGDIMLITDALNAVRPGIEIERAYDGEDMLGLIEHSEKAPDLILLDLNMPGVNGHDALRRLRTTSRHSQTPVIIFTTSSADRDIDAAYKNHANAYVQKPGDYSAFQETLKRICDFWLNDNHAPTVKVNG